MDSALAKILIADDSTHAQRMGAKILTAEGHQVSTVSNGQAAIQSLEQAAPELVIADVFMPGTRHRKTGVRVVLSSPRFPPLHATMRP